jgi:hypothetical protein
MDVSHIPGAIDHEHHRNSGAHTMIDAPRMIPQETTMEPDDLDAALIRLRDSLGDLATLSNIIISIRRNADRLLDPLTSVLQETRNAIDHTLSVLEDRP